MEEQVPVEEKKEIEVDPVGAMEDVSDDTAEVDRLLLEANPDYAESIKDIGPELSDSKVIIETIDFSGGSEQEELKQFSLFKKLKIKLKTFGHKIYARLAAFLISLKYVLIAFALEFPKKALHGIKSFFGAIAHAVSTFKDWNWKKKILFLLVFGSLGAITAVYILMLKKDVLNKPDFPFIGSMSEVASAEFTFDQEKEIEPFYKSSRIKIYAYEMTAFFVNLKRLPKSENPMGMFHLVFEGNNRDVLVELKEKESHFRDIAQRELEMHSFDELDQTDGKRLVFNKIRELYNQELASGEVVAVQIKNIILKP